MAKKTKVAICKWCKKQFVTHNIAHGIYCSRPCKSEWQRTQKPVDRDWLYEKYIVEGLDCTAISKIVERNSKRVWEWIRDYGIPTRPRGFASSAYHYTPGQVSTFKGKKHSAETRAKLSAIAKADGRVPFDPAVGSYMKGRKGPDTPTWKGGCTPERNAFYSSPEWKAAVRAIWIRDNATCQRCEKKNSGKERFAFDIHHIVSFAYAPLRAEVSNLVLLCEKCHYWVHSNENIERLFIKEIPSA